jgi:cytoskeletal protein CcmA (bactofilin family)
MKKRIQLALLLVLLVALALPGTAYARGLFEDKVVFGGTYTLKSGETLDGTLLVFGGMATLESGSTVTKDVVVMGGTVDAKGTIEGDVVAIGGQVDLAATAVVEGDVAAIGATVDQRPGAVVEGRVVTQIEGPMTLSIAKGIRLPAVRMMGFQGIFSVAWFFLKILLWMVLAAVVVLFIPDRTRRAADTVVSQPLSSGGLGLLTALILPPVLVLLSITICLLPVALVALIIAVLIWAFGLIAIGYELGVRLARLAKQEWAPAVNAGFGTFVLMLILNTVGSLLPCVGWILPFLVGCIGFGSVVLTRLGAQAYPLPLQTSVAPLAPAEVPAPVESPAGDESLAGAESPVRDEPAAPEEQAPPPSDIPPAA